MGVDQEKAPCAAESLFNVIAHLTLHVHFSLCVGGVLEKDVVLQKKSLSDGLTVWGNLIIFQNVKIVSSG